MKSVLLAYDVSVSQSLFDLSADVKLPRVWWLLIFQSDNRTIRRVDASKNGAVASTSNLLLDLIAASAKRNDLILTQLRQVQVGDFVVDRVLAIREIKLDKKSATELIVEWIDVAFFKMFFDRHDSSFHSSSLEVFIVLRLEE